MNLLSYFQDKSMWKHNPDFRYVELLAPQKSPKWHASRKRVTASNIEKMTGHSNFGTPEEYVDEIFGRREKSFTPQAITRMDLGTQMEDPIRKFHITRYPGAVVEEPSLCISLRWYNLPITWIGLDEKFPGETMYDRFGSQLSNPLHPNWFWAGSPDGVITFQDGTSCNLEIKYTERGYPNLIKNCREYPKIQTRVTPGPVFGPMIPRSTSEIDGQKYDAVDPYDHIWRSHWYQQLTCMAANGRRSCDYAVGSKEYLYTERLPFDEDYWIGYLYPAIIRFVVCDLLLDAPNTYIEKFKAEIKEIIETCQLQPEHEEMVEVKTKGGDIKSNNEKVEIKLNEVEHNLDDEKIKDK
jgi:hypothetical protein